MTENSMVKAKKAKTSRLAAAVRSSQFMLLVLLVGTVLAFGFINPSILSLASFFSLTRSIIIPAAYALSQMLVMVQGGVDISNAAIGSFAGYCSSYIFTSQGIMDVPIAVNLAIAVAIGVGFQLVNWFLISRVGLDPFITTLAMQTTIQGAIFAFVSTSYIYTLPSGMAAYSTSYLARAQFPDGIESVLHSAVLVVGLMYAVMHVILEHTNFGRSVYAIGDDVEAASRAGIRVRRVRFWVFILAGVICGVAGILHDSLSRNSTPMPRDVVGQELTTIAAVVLGIGATKQARGSVAGTLLGVAFLRFVATNLIMLGISSYWQQMISGLIIFVGFLMQMSRKQSRKIL